MTRIVPQSDDTFLLQFPPQVVSGEYTLSVGPFVSDLAGVNMDQDQDNRNGELVEDVFIGRLTIDSQGPVVTAHSPTGRIVEPLSSIVVDFSEPIAAASFTVADVAITTPTGTQAATKVSRLAASRFQIEFPRQTVGGVYQLRVGPGITDLVGNAMDQDGDQQLGEEADAYQLEIGSDCPIWWSRVPRYLPQWPTASCCRSHGPCGTPDRPWLRPPGPIGRSCRATGFWVTTTMF